MRLAIVGSRFYPRPDIVADLIATLPPDTTIVSGGAHGPDAWAAHVAGCYNLPEPIVLKPRWALGLHAGFKRNSEIVALADKMIAFWDGESRGTQDTILKAALKGIEIVVVGKP